MTIIYCFSLIEVLIPSFVIYFFDMYTVVKNEEIFAHKVHVVCPASEFRKQQRHDLEFGLTDVKF